jgi:hypothetical protein
MLNCVVNGERHVHGLSWDAADSFCRQYNSTLLSINVTLDSIEVVWIGVRKNTAFVWTQCK